MLLPPVPGPLPICNLALPEHVTAITENGFLRGPRRGVSRLKALPPLGTRLAAMASAAPVP